MSPAYSLEHDRACGVKLSFLCLHCRLPQHDHHEHGAEEFATIELLGYCTYA
jgi:hypothetical protein